MGWFYVNGKGFLHGTNFLDETLKENDKCVSRGKPVKNKRGLMSN